MFEARKVAGSAKYKQRIAVSKCVSLQGEFVYSVMKTKFVRVCVISLFRDKNK